jgi:hypothetical protein
MESWNKVIGLSICAGILAAFLLCILLFDSSADPSNLRAEYTVGKADIGVPGITKMYEARLVNVSRRAVRIEVCAFVDDASAPGEAVAFAVQRYDSKNSAWITIVDASDARACRPYPLGWITAELKRKWLWPNKWVSMGEEATAARGFHKGDSARFVLFTSFKRSNQKPPQAIPTPAFVIDEEAGAGAEGLRIRH